MWHNVINRGGGGPGAEGGARILAVLGPGTCPKRSGEAGGSIWAKYRGKWRHGDPIQAIFAVFRKFFQDDT